MGSERAEGVHKGRPSCESAPVAARRLSNGRGEKLLDLDVLIDVSGEKRRRG